MLSFVLFGSRLRGVLGAWWSRWFGCLFSCLLCRSLVGVLRGGLLGFCLGWFCGFCFCGLLFCSGCPLWVLSPLSSLGSVSFGSPVLVFALFRGCRVAGFACPFPLFRGCGWVGSSGRFVLLWSLAVLVSFRLCGFGFLLQTHKTQQPPRLQHLPRFWQQRDKSPLRPAGFVVAGVNPRHFYKIRLTYQNNCDKLIVGSTVRQ